MPWQKMIGWGRTDTGTTHLVLEFGGRPITFCRSLDFRGELAPLAQVPRFTCKTCLRYYEAHKHEVCGG